MLNYPNFALPGNAVFSGSVTDLGTRNEQVRHRARKLKNIRVYEQRSGHWQMLMSRTIEETNELFK